MLQVHDSRYGLECLLKSELNRKRVADCWVAAIGAGGKEMSPLNLFDWPTSPSQNPTPQPILVIRHRLILSKIGIEEKGIMN